jgi:stage II sporulation protein R
MKKIFCFFLCIVVVLVGALEISNVKAQAAENDISNKIIRFHVIANSDSINDQAVKLKVRDDVLSYLSPKLKKSGSLAESREILNKNSGQIKKIAEAQLRKSGYNYSVKTELSNENFPIKTYGNITLPQGKYQAYRIIIGSGKGQNWWCVMFPPLCFVDITTGSISYKQTQKEMMKVLTPEEYSLVDNQNVGNIKIKFKFLEIFNKIFS